MIRNKSFYTVRTENRLFPEAQNFVQTAYKIYFGMEEAVPIKKVQIAGTNGKGSTAAMLSSILACAGYRVGLNISPSLVCVNERISINGTMISDADLEKYIPALEQAQCEVGRVFGGFERITAASYLYFAENKVDIAVMETGLGGRYDTVSAVPECILASITGIGLDHMVMLGDTIPEIAMEKCGIMREGVPTVAHVQEQAATDVIVSEAQKLHSDLEFTDECEVFGISEGIIGQKFRIAYRGEEYMADIKLAGFYQQDNAKNALICANKLNSLGFCINKAAIEQGFVQTAWHGRLEPVSIKGINSTIILDGSHNPHAMKNFVAGIKRLLGDEKHVVLLSVMADKDIDGILSELKEIADKVVCTSVTARSCTPDALCDKVSAHGITACVAESVKDGLIMCDSLARNNKVLCVGSLYLVGAVLAIKDNIAGFACKD